MGDNFMKQADTEEMDEMRAEYTAADLGPLVRGKYVARCSNGAETVVTEAIVLTIPPLSIRLDGA